MKKGFFYIKFILPTVLLLLPMLIAAQESKKIEPTPFEKKLLLGFSYHNYWTTVDGDNLPPSYFYKPSLGFSLKAEYYLRSFVGVSVGAGFQQRGAGILSPDFDKSQGNADSTYRKRLRFNSIEFPISLLLRTPKDVVKGLRFKASAGIIPLINIQSNEVFLSIEDGNHTRTDVSNDYWKNDLAYQLTIGPEINTGSGILQIDFVYSHGTKNIYSTGSATGYNQSVGFRLSWLFACQTKKKSHQTISTLK
jgi:Outer membrane protein beta-barrel domain